MIFTIYKRALAVLMKRPLALWGISLLSIVLCSMTTALFAGALGIALAINLLLTTSMTMVYLHGYRGEGVKVVQLFDCFKDWSTIKRVLGGMLWMFLWTFIWGLIPIAGPIIAIMKFYEYRLTPYILVTEPDVPITEAIKVSSQRTNGWKGKMFGAEILVVVFILAAYLVLGLLSAIPVLGALFALALVLLHICVCVLIALFYGLIQAAFYEEITNPTPVAAPVAVPRFIENPEAQQQAKGSFCTRCGAPLPPGSNFCTNCGQKLN